MNLIPDRIPETGDYYCTWATQARIRPMEMGDDAKDVRENMNEDVLFGERGILSEYMKEIRPDLIALLDDGWDVPPGTRNPENTGRFGSLEPDPARFPSFTGTPEERLGKICRKISSLGWRGTGVWVACQMPFADGEAPETADKAREYWEDRAAMCSRAGISYWKVDWGRMSENADYRVMLTESVRKRALGMMIEHYPRGMYPPFGKYVCGEDRMIDDEVMYNRRILENSDFLRTYDVLGEFSTAITMNRVGLLAGSGLCASDRCRGILNVEDSVYLGAALGCSVGVMRHQRFEKGRERESTARYAEVVRAVRWHRIAPPFAFRSDEVRVSDRFLTDSYAYPPREPDVWPFVAGKTMSFRAPEAISRRCELPRAEGDAIPFLAASKNPLTGAYAIAALDRTTGGKTLEYLPAKVSAYAGEPCDIGVFGRYETLTLEFDRDISGKRVLMQDIFSDSAEDVTAGVQRVSGRLVIPGELIDRICDRHDPGDTSAPGIVIKLAD